MKLNLTLIGESFEDEEEILVALNGSKYKTILSDVREWLRQQIKYSKGDIPAETAEIVRDFILEAARELNVEI